MQRTDSIRFDKRPEGQGIIWSHEYANCCYPGKLLPGYLVSAKCCGAVMYLEIVDVPHERSVKARIVELDDDIDNYGVIQIFEEDRVLSLSRDHLFSCEPPAGEMSKKEKSATVMLKTQCLDVFDVN